MTGSPRTTHHWWGHLHQIGEKLLSEVEGTELVCSGITGGTSIGQEGGRANYLCMPKDTEPEVEGMHGSMCTGLNMKVLYKEHIIIMFPVLCYVCIYVLDQLYL